MAAKRTTKKSRAPKSAGRKGAASTASKPKKRPAPASPPKRQRVGKPTKKEPSRKQLAGPADAAAEQGMASSIRDAFKARFREALADFGRVLRAEKARRGLPPDALAFVGMHNIAQVHWCPAQAVFQSVANESGFFFAYLQDRVRWAMTLGKVSRPPRTLSDLLCIGDELTFEEVFAKHRMVVAATPPTPAPVVLPGRPEEWHPPPADPMNYGRWAETFRGEQYPTLRWNFPYGTFVVVGVPDGLTEDFAYEFKASGKEYFMMQARPGALAQCDLYCLFFERRRRRVQLYMRQEDRTETIDSEADYTNARATLALFEQAMRGENLRPPREAWKCRKCEYREQCSIRRE